MAGSEDGLDGIVAKAIDDAGTDADGNGKLAGSGSGFIDPAASTGKKRGRPRRDSGTGTGDAGNKPGGKSAFAGGSGRKRTAKEETVLLGELSDQIAGAHEIIALVTGQPVFKLSDDESKKLSQSIRNVLVHYDLTPNPAVMAWVQLLAVSGVIYGPRIMYLVALEKERKARSSMPFNIQTTENRPTDEPAT